MLYQGFNDDYVNRLIAEDPETGAISLPISAIYYFLNCAGRCGHFRLSTISGRKPSYVYFDRCAAKNLPGLRVSEPLLMASAIMF